MEVRAAATAVIALSLCFSACGDDSDESDSATDAGAGSAGASGSIGAGGSSGTSGGAGGIGGSSGSGGAGAQGGSGGSSAGTGGQSSGCEALLADVQAKLIGAKACSSLDNQQCKGIVDGICCSESVDAKESQETLEYLSALQQYKASCTPSCPPEPCPSFSAGYCSQGQCVPFTG